MLKRMQRRLSISFVAVCVLFALLTIRLMFIERTSGERYEKKVLSQQEYDSTIIPYQRGDITDRRGTVLATSVDVYNVILDSKVLNSVKKTNEKNKKNTDIIETTLQYLSFVFPDIDIEEARKTIVERPDNQYYVLKKHATYDDMKTFSTLASDKETKNKIAGIWFEKEYVRGYPYGSFASSVIGFVSSDGNGVTGLENRYNSTLNGINGRSYGYVDEESTVAQTVIEAVNGNTLVSTLDMNVQTIVENEIKAWNDTRINEENNARFGSKNTAALVMDPSNGEILAMATYPTFDLNSPRDLSAFYSEEELKALTSEEQFNALNTIWQNYCVSHSFEPGSTFKPFTIATGLETGTVKGDEVYECDGGEQIGPDYVKCMLTHGQLDVKQSLEQSCNDALMQMSYAIGADNFSEYQHLFGFGQKTGIDLPGEARTDTLIYSKEDLGRTINIATNSFGQNFNVTMIQLASAFASIVNGGNLYKPHMVKSIVDPSGNTQKTFSPEIEKKTLSPEVSEELKTMLRAVVEEGTGSIAGVLGYDIGGKTGTAQKLPRSEGKNLVSFIGYAPQEDPKVLIYVVVDEPNDPDQAHSVFAQEIAHNILVQILPYLNIEKVDQTQFDEKIEYTSMFTKIDTEGTVNGGNNVAEGDGTENAGNTGEQPTEPSEGA
ncbi:MAG: penicillin-binding protein 2 [Lachnospiraceae bacterium]|nr:penicillin-binding protein 2 [Lachnospiraceae bacterium]